jgi:tetratricopeptide (TPR) repeat protein
MLTDLEQAEKLLQQGNYLAAEKILRNLLRLEPQNGQAQWGMGNLALIARRPDKAISFLKNACRLLPNEPMPLIQLAKACNETHSENDALAVLEHGVKVAPQLPQMHYELGQQLLMLGKLADAELCFRKVLTLGEDVLICYSLLEISRLKRFHSADADVQLIRACLAKPTLTEQQSIVLHYSLGKVYDDLGDYKLAWESFSRANTLQLVKSGFKTIELDSFYQKIRALNTPQTLAKKRNPSTKEITPVFIVGLPRTGSTLLEHMLARHKDVAGAGELPYVGGEVADYFFARTQQYYPDYLADMTPEQISEAANLYLKLLSQHSQGEPYVIDKLPANYQSIGLIYILFPNAKVINLRRNLADVALSVFKNYFAENEPYFCDIREFEHYSKLYTEIMRHWQDSLPGFVYELSYEDLVGDPETTLRGVLEFCNIQWDDACIGQGHMNQPVKTLSSTQVRQPIYRSSTAHWKNYKEHLQWLVSD